MMEEYIQVFYSNQKKGWRRKDSQDVSGEETGGLYPNSRTQQEASIGEKAA